MGLQALLIQYLAIGLLLLLLHLPHLLLMTLQGFLLQKPMLLLISFLDLSLVSLMLVDLNLVHQLAVVLPVEVSALQTISTCLVLRVPDPLVLDLCFLLQRALQIAVLGVCVVLFVHLVNFALFFLRFFLLGDETLLIACERVVEVSCGQDWSARHRLQSLGLWDWRFLV